MISVVIPCYNAAATIGETIDSALAQDAELEVVVVDDGSTDASVEVLQRYGDAIAWVSTPNRGASAARTLGTEMARGSHIQYLDSDDLLMQGTLTRRRNAMKSTRADVAHTDWQKLEQAASGGFYPGTIMQPDLAAIAHDAPCAAATSRFWAPPAALLYSRSVVARIGPWSPRLPVIQDARFLFDAAEMGARFVHVPGIGAQYRVSAGSLSRRDVKSFIADCVVNTSEIEAVWLAKGPLTEARSKALAEMWSHVATSALINGLDDFETARQGYNRAAGRRAVFELGRLVRAALGPARAAAAINAARTRRTRENRSNKEMQPRP